LFWLNRYSGQPIAGPNQTLPLSPFRAFGKKQHKIKMQLSSNYFRIKNSRGRENIVLREERKRITKRAERERLKRTVRRRFQRQSRRERASCSEALSQAHHLAPSAVLLASF
jgi:hypothetical protein